MLKNPLIRRDRYGWPLCGLMLLLLCIAVYPNGAMSRDKPVAYILNIEGEKLENYKIGSAISNGETIKIGPATHVQVFHKSHKQCRTIRISGEISVTFRRTSYSPKSSRKIQILKEGCAPTCTPKGTDAGVVMRGSTSELIVVDTDPDFLLEGDISQYRQITIIEQQNPKKSTALKIFPSTSLVTWPSGLKPLKLNTTYKIVLAGPGGTLAFHETFQTTAASDDRKASGLVIVDLSDAN